jgi:putative hydrolase
MIDIHTHTIFSDGDLVPSELVRRAEVIGLTGIAFTDHGDLSNIDFIIPRVVLIADELNQVLDIQVLPGIEVTHVPPSLIGKTVARARELGAKIVSLHGESIVEPIAPGTNKAGLEAGIDLLAHPGLLTEEEAVMAREKGILLEITARKGHCLTNGHIAQLAKKIGAKLVINSDAHTVGDLVGESLARQIARGAGLTETDFDIMQENARSLF